jgi:hypothetical protein
VKLIDRETEHLQAILRTQGQVRYTHVEKVIHAILADRGVKPEAYYAAEMELFAKWREAERKFPLNS